jgi:hypothetical protein
MAEQVILFMHLRVHHMLTTPRLPLDFIQIVIFELKPYHEEIQRHTSTHLDTTKSPSLPSIQHLVSHPPLVTRAFIMSDPIKTWARSASCFVFSSTI